MSVGLNSRVESRARRFQSNEDRRRFLDRLGTEEMIPSDARDQFSIKLCRDEPELLLELGLATKVVIERALS